MSTTQVTTPDDIIILANQKKTDYFLSLVKSMPVTTAEEYQMAADEVRKIISTHKGIDDERTSFTGPLGKVIDGINAKYMPHLKLLRNPEKGAVSAESILKGKMIAFQEAEAARVEAARREAQRLADIERRRLEAEAAELRRKQEEEAAAARRAEEQRAAAARAEEAKIAAEAAAARGKKAKAESEARAAEVARLNAEAAARAEADAMERKQRAEAEAEALEQTAAVVTAAPVVAVAKVIGISAPKTVDYEFEDFPAWVKFVVEHRPDLMGILDADPAKMRALVKLQGLATKMPGLRVFPKTGITVR